MGENEVPERSLTADSRDKNRNPQDGPLDRINASNCESHYEHVSELHEKSAEEGPSLNPREVG